MAVVGDASIVNGTSFEALNNLGLVKRQLLIVLNDNEMAIDATVGALAKYFSKVRLSQTYEDLRKTTNNILDHLPGIGRSVEEAVERIKKSIRMVLPASQMFESLNIPYFGPVLGAIPAIFFGVLRSPWHVLYVIVLFVMVNQIETIFLTPRIIGRSLGMHPITVIYLVLVGGKIFGVLGMIFAIPLGALILILLSSFYELWFGLSSKDAKNTKLDLNPKKLD